MRRTSPAALSAAARALAVVALALTALFADAPAWASDEPHGGAYAGAAGACGTCHAVHKALGGNLTSVAGNVALCQSCHTTLGAAKRFDIAAMAPANVTTKTGSSHAWGVSPTNPSAGATPPTNTAMLSRLSGGIACSTCHDEHRNGFAVANSGRQWTEKVATQTVSGGTVAFSFNSSAAAPSKGYLVEIVSGGAAGTATYHVSNDGGVTWTAALATGGSVSLDANVTAAMSGTFTAAAQYKFYVSYPFLRAALDTGTNAAGGKFCRDCHASWVNDTAAVRSWTAGDPLKHHPVGVVMPSAGAYRGPAGILNASGAAQGTSASDPLHDLALASDNTVQCYTCHGMHHSDSNTLSVWNP